MRRAKKDTSLPAEQLYVLSACILRALPLFLLFLSLLAWRSELSCSACVDTGALERCRVPVGVLCRQLTRVLLYYCPLLPLTAPYCHLLPLYCPVLPLYCPVLPPYCPVLPHFFPCSQPDQTVNLLARPKVASPAGWRDLGCCWHSDQVIHAQGV